MELLLEYAPSLDPSHRRLEVVEKKGLGHPDTICDEIAEAVSHALARYYFETFGSVLHYNVDKVLLCGGASQARFGGGKIHEPLEIFLAGRATSQVGDRLLPIADLAVTAAQAWIRSKLPTLDVERNVRIHPVIRSGSQDLQGVFSKSLDSKTLLSNDSSIGVAFAPLTRLERLVLIIDQALGSPETQARFPYAGADTKVLGVRTDDSAHLTVACAFIDRFIHSPKDYQQKKEELRNWIAGSVRNESLEKFTLVLNAADDLKTETFYLTVSGTSAEAGDDGEVGRGNRINGLITPHRIMTIEAPAGKNAVTHTGRIYQRGAQRIVNALLGSPLGLSALECTLVSKIGHPIEDPPFLGLRFDGTRGASLSRSDEDKIRQLCSEELQQLKHYWREELQSHAPT